MIILGAALALIGSAIIIAVILTDWLAIVPEVGLAAMLVGCTAFEVGVLVAVAGSFYHALFTMPKPPAEWPEAAPPRYLCQVESKGHSWLDVCCDVEERTCAEYGKMECARIEGRTWRVLDRTTGQIVFQGWPD